MSSTLASLLFSSVKCSVNAVIIAYPAYQTFKVLEGRRLADAHHMLTFWCVTCFVHSLQSIADEMLGQHHRQYSYQLVCLILKLAPIIVGPEKLYQMIVKPFFIKQEKNVDVIVQTAAHEKNHAQATLKTQGTLKDKLKHEVSHIKESVQNAKQLLKQETPAPPTLSSNDRDHLIHAHGNDSCHPHSSQPKENHELLTTAILEKRKEMHDETHVDEKIKHEPIIRQVSNQQREMPRIKTVIPHHNPSPAATQVSPTAMTIDDAVPSTAPDSHTPFLSMSHGPTSELRERILARHQEL